VSLKRKVIAFFAKILRCVPIHRPRDVAAVGEGTIQSEGILSPHSAQPSEDPMRHY
jgi:hypothetical protein